MSHVALLVVLAASGPLDAPLDVSHAVEEVMLGARDAVRVAVPPVVVDVEAHAAGVDVLRLEKAIVRALVERGREEVVSPATIRARAADVVASGPTSATSDVTQLGSDHTLLAQVELESAGPVLRLRLIFSETSEVLATASTPLVAAASATSSSSSPSPLSSSGEPARRDVRVAVDDLVADVAWAVESAGDDVRTHRIVVMPLKGDDEAHARRIDRFVGDALVQAVVRRGFLVVERAALDDVLDAASAERVGQVLGAQSMIVGAVSTTGTSFTINVRLLSTSTGAVLGASSTSVMREGVVAMADVETRTPLEAAVRSAIAPGWGQAYNRRGDKALVFGLAGYGSIATTVGLGVGGALVHARYQDPSAFDDLPEEQRAKAATDTKALGDGLYVSTIVAGAIAASVWSLGIVDAILDSERSSGPQARDVRGSE